jgi:hypothetical protein
MTTPTPAVVSSVVIYRDTSYRLITVKVTLNKTTTETQKFSYNVVANGAIQELPLPTSSTKGVFFITDDGQGMFVVPSGYSTFSFGLSSTFGTTPAALPTYNITGTGDFDQLLQTAIKSVNEYNSKKTTPVIQYTVNAPNPGVANILSFSVGGIVSSIVTTTNIEAIPLNVINVLPPPAASPSDATQSGVGPNPYNYSTHLNRVITALENIATAQTALAYRAREQLAISEEILEKLSSIESLSKDAGIKTAGAYDWLSYSSLLGLYEEEGKDLQSLKNEFNKKMSGGQ